MIFVSTGYGVRGAGFAIFLLSIIGDKEERMLNIQKAEGRSVSRAANRVYQSPLHPTPFLQQLSIPSKDTRL